jgi:hypothetical protein
MDLEKKLIDFYEANKNQLLNFEDVISKTSKFSFTSKFYLYRKLLTQYVNKENFLFGFDFGVCILKDKLVFLGDKLWIHENFDHIDQIIIKPNEGRIIRGDYKTWVKDVNSLYLFISLKNILSNKSEKVKQKLNNKINNNLSIHRNVEINYIPQVDIDFQILKFIKKIYSANKSKSFILSEYELKRKINEVYFFSKGDIWTGFYPLRNLLNGGYSKTLLSNGIFGLVSGIYIYSTYVEFIFSNDGKGPGGFNEHSSIRLFDLKNDYEKHFQGLTFKLGKYEKTITNDEKDFLINLFRGSFILYSKHKEILENDKEELKRKNNQIREFQRQKEAELRMIKEEKEKQRKIQLEEIKFSVISELDKDGNNEIDLVDNEIFSKLLSNNQKKISEIDRNYIQKFVKISIYLKTKKSNIQKIFESIKTIQNEAELNELVSLLRNQIHTYDLLVFHSLNMMTSLVEDENITFFEIYECFDQLGVFNSNWENEVSGKLTDIGHRIKDLMYSIYKMENKIIHSIQELSYINQSNFIILSNSINGQLKKIDSSVEYSNFMNKIKNYKLYNLDF